MTSTVLSGFNNVYSLSALGKHLSWLNCLCQCTLQLQQYNKKETYNLLIPVITTVGGIAFIIFHHLNQFYLLNKQLVSNENICESVPASIYFFAVMMTSLSSFHYIKNTALRKFAMKYIKKKILIFKFQRFKLSPAGSYSGSFNSIPNSRLFTKKVHPSNFDRSRPESLSLADIEMINISRIPSENNMVVENIEQTTIN